MMNLNYIHLNYIHMITPDLQLLDGYDDCIAGIVTKYGQGPIVCYYYDKIIEKLMLDMSHIEAIEYFEYNIIGSYVGKHTPCFLETGEINE
jgi:hypothetical protein